MPISILDIAVLGVTLISAVLAAVRGFAREVLSISAWVVAAAAAWFLHPLMLPFAHQYISHDTIALAATIGVIFIVTLLVMSLITVQISDLILDSRIGAMDRTLGLIFGVARGFLICILGWMIFSMLAEGNANKWADDSKLKPILQSSSDSIRGTFNNLYAKYKKDKPESGTGAPPPEAAPTGNEGAAPGTAN